ncbi:MAG: hypothetical protein IK021_05045, partial [Methanobrevibacter sp.]|nr:hypothetical protein [Methanobrevibacter sp.]
NGCTGKDTITITDGTADNPASQTNSSSSVNTNNDTRPAVDSGGITREEADKYGYTYTPDHGGHYIGKNDHWDENAGKYHD